MLISLQMKYLSLIGLLFLYSIISWSQYSEDHLSYHVKTEDQVGNDQATVVYIDGQKIYNSVRALAQDECGRRGSLVKSYKATSESLLEIRCDDEFLIQTPRLNTLLRQEGRYGCAREHSAFYAVYFSFQSGQAIGNHRVKVECGTYDYVP